MKITGDAGYVSARIFRGVERSSGAAQASAEFTGNGFHGGVWTSQPFANDAPAETDLDAGYALKLTSQLTLVAGLTQYLFTNAPAGATRQSTEAGLRAAWADDSGMTASFAYFRDFRLQANTVEVAAGYSVPLKSLGSYLELKTFAGWAKAANVRPDSPAPRVHDGYAYFGAGVELPYRVGAHTTVVAGAHFSDAIGQDPAWSPTGASGGLRGWFTLAVKFD